MLRIPTSITINVILAGTNNISLGLMPQSPTEMSHGVVALVEDTIHIAVRAVQAVELVLVGQLLTHMDIPMLNTAIPHFLTEISTNEQDVTTNTTYL